MDERILKDAQYRKGLSIAYFNALNNAIEIVKAIYATRNLTDEELKKLIADWRGLFLDEHKEYYAQVIAKVGTNYNLAETVKKLKATKNIEELRKVWQSLSEDERQDVEVKKVTVELKKKYEKA